MIRFPDLIRKHAFHTPERQATHFEGRSFTWAEFNARVHGFAQALSDIGTQPGERVAFLGLNSHWLVETYFAPSLIGAIAVPLNFRLSEEELVVLLQDCTPSVLIVDRHFQAQAGALMARCPSIRQLVFADWSPPGPDLPSGALGYDAILVPDVAPEAFEARASGSDEAILIVYTSGTTGVPKGVMLTHANLLANATGTGELLHYTPEDVVLIAGPLFHVATGARVFTSVLYGGRIVIQPRFDVEDCMALVSRERITTMTLVPTMFQMILDHPRFSEFDFSSLRCATYGSAPMPVALVQRLMAAIPGVTFAQGYGMTEAAPVLSILTPEDHVPEKNGQIAKLASVGKPMRYCDVRIVDAGGKALPTGETGQVIVRGPQVMKGYWKRPDATAEVIRHGFYHTGDAGFLDADGYLYLAGRTKEMIITGGENVYPIETENCLARHPAVAACAVLGLPDARWGEIVFAAVALLPGASATEPDLIAYCRAEIAHYKAPRGIRIWEGPLPLNPANKIDKIRIKADLMSEA